MEEGAHEGKTNENGTTQSLTSCPWVHSDFATHSPAFSHLLTYRVIIRFLFCSCSPAVLCSVHTEAVMPLHSHPPTSSHNSAGSPLTHSHCWPASAQGSQVSNNPPSSRIHQQLLPGSFVEQLWFWPGYVHCVCKSGAGLSWESC